MQQLMGMTFATFCGRLLTEPIVLIKTLFTYWWLSWCRPRNRLNLYDPRDVGNAKRGPFFLPVEKEVEEPVRFPTQENVVDSVLFFGGNSEGDRLVARVSREGEGHVTWLYLKLKDGRSYLPAGVQRSYPPAEEYVGGGLKLKCLVPMRRWRISFNGLLREAKDGSSETRTLHVQFSFLCISASIPLDLYSGISTSHLADLLATDSRSGWIPDLKLVENQADRFVQQTTFIGTLKVAEDEELEMDLWGIRLKSKDFYLKDGKSSSLKEVLGYTKDGQVICAGEYHLPTISRKLVFGLFLERSGLTWPITDCHIKFLKSQPIFSGVIVNIKTVRSEVTANVEAPSVSLDLSAGINTGFTARGHLSEFRTHDEDIGYSFTVEYEWRNLKEFRAKPSWILSSYRQNTNSTSKFVLSLEEPSCQSVSISGGKGCSLAALTYLSKKYSTNFRVPNGFVITTTAYKEFYETSGIKPMVLLFEKNAWCLELKELEASCVSLVDGISKVTLPVSIQRAIQEQLEQTFPGLVGTKKFAVRSSASGEDSEDMSAAGQMSTFLGIVGLENIFESVVKCWASQFAFTAIQYKRQNGQELNSMMAVVVQEMVPADIAGVLFTCDPVTGNPQNVTISANYGIGESVVSATAEPDTIILHRNETQELLVKSVRIGGKSLKMVMVAEGNVVEEHVDEQNKSVCCISNEDSKKLGDASLKIEEAYGVPVDIEWAYREGQLYLLQARPITTFDKESRRELLHSADDAVRTEEEFNTSANTGEVSPNAASHLGITWLAQTVAAVTQYLYVGRNPYAFPCHPFAASMPKCINHVFISIPGMALRFYSKEEKQSFLSEAGMIGGFGRILEEQEIFDQADRRNKTFPTTFAPYQLILFIRDLLFGQRIMEKSIKKFQQESFDFSKCSNSKDLFRLVWKKSVDNIHVPANHWTTSFNSSICNNIVMSILRTATNEWNSTVFSDISWILSSCGEVESADIPLSIQKLVKSIRDQNDGEKFRKMDKQEALNWLETSNTPAGEKFKEFIKRHGHRCLMESDLYSKPWRINKLPLMKVLQDSIDVEKKEKQFVPVSEIINKLQSPVTNGQKRWLRFFIPLCQKAVMDREKSKALWMKYIDCLREGFWALAEMMVKEGRLPEAELMFFLTNDELQQLIETRNPTWVRKAIRRKAIFPELHSLRFPEICKGIPKPINQDQKTFEDYQSDLELKGTPVSQGIIQGYVRVAVNLEEAALIQRGEILIAYATDIAWSPYFPLLSGVATELGGLISHGAVVAREYGLPCVVGVFDATLKFKTGDFVELDGNKGILKRIPNHLEELTEPPVTN